MKINYALLLKCTILLFCALTQHQTHSTDFLDNYVGADTIMARVKFNIPENFTITIKKNNNISDHTCTARVYIHENDSHLVAKLKFVIDYKEQEITLKNSALKKNIGETTGENGCLIFLKSVVVVVIAMK